ncbi:uncharacterized protein LOC134260453 [Saccostrea cucullata]|uniref:uncharacterized protein LOC134260453 n=1 Tax=Saccostrea cuccullata TaxID=36930 RepID=UPI002ED0627C
MPSRRLSKTQKQKKYKIRRANNRKARNIRRIKRLSENTNNNVLNLSDYTLSEAETSLLSKGLKFIPTPGTQNIRQNLICSFNELARKMRCKILFHTNEDDKQLHPLYINTNYNPGNTTCTALENYLYATKMELCKIHFHKFRDNLTKKERNALTSLRNETNIVIKKADKSTTVVVQNRTNYAAEGLRQLNDGIHYAAIHKDRTHEIHDLINKIVCEMQINSEIDSITHRFLSQSLTFRPGRLYLLPKIHKICISDIENFKGTEALQRGMSIPGRPIISQCASPTMPIGHFIDYFLVPLVQKQHTYVRDTKHFISKVESLHLKPETRLVTYDVTSMYTNMTATELLQSAAKALTKLKQTDVTIPIPDISNLIKLLQILLENNEFEFNGHLYKQILGASMGAVPYPEICDLRLFDILENIIKKYNHKNKILAHFRYRDDGLMALDATESEILQFFELANQEHKYLKFTYNIHLNETVFLDTKVYKGQRFKQSGVLDFETFIKPTETFMYLHRSSAHPNATFRGFIKGEIIRHKRNTSDPHKTKQLISQFKERLISRGYSESEIDSIVSETQTINRQELLKKIARLNLTDRPLCLLPSTILQSENGGKYYANIGN